MSISLLDNTDLLLAYRRIRTPENRALLEATHNGPLYLDEIDDIADRLEAEADGALPFAEELRDEDIQHDALGLYLWHQFQSYQALAPIPIYAGAARQAAEFQQRYIDRRGRLAEGYGEQAARAGRMRRTFDDDRVGLQRFGGADEDRLDDMVSQFLNSGDRIGELLGRRGEVLAERAQARDEGGRNLRGQAIGLLGELRTQLGNESKRRDNLPADLDGRLFGLLDERIARRANQARPAAPEQPAPIVAGSSSDTSSRR